MSRSNLSVVILMVCTIICPGCNSGPEMFVGGVAVGAYEALEETPSAQVGDGYR